MSLLRVDGLVGPAGPLELAHDDLFRAPLSATVPDVGALVPGRRGAGVRFDWIVARADPPQEARWVTVEAADGGFAASLPIEELDVAVVVHADGDRPLDADGGGPFRLYVPGYRDACSNVKHLARITFSDVPGRDTRPRPEERDCVAELDGGREG